MNTYLVLKYIHILSAVILAGTGLGIAFFMFMANRSGNPQAIMVTARHVVLADWIFTTPAVITQLITGILLMQQLGYTWNSTWFIAVISLFVFIGACWVPVVVVQYRLRNIAMSMDTRPDLQSAYKRLMRIWTVLGIMAFSAILIVFWLMVVKPLPVH